jgi:Amt family ammonium transporter
MLLLVQLQEILGKSYDRIFILESLETVRRGISLAWTMVCLIFMFMMQAGFCLMATGAARSKSKSSILTHQILIICVTALVYFCLSSYLVIAAEGGLLGIEQALPKIEKENLDPRTLDKIEQELFTYMKILTCATIACIQLQERTLIETFGILSFVIAGVIAPIGLAWIKGDGWLERLGFKDSTGCSVVYMCGGVCGFVGNLMLGPRFSIFTKQTNNVKKTSY